MSKSSQFKVPIQDTSAANFKPVTRLPEHLDQYATISADARAQMTPVMQNVLSLMDKVVLRTTALPQPE